MEATTNAADALPTHSQGRRNPQKSSNALPDAWVLAIFKRLRTAFGSRFDSTWAGVDSADMVALWAEELAPYASNPDAIGWALKEAVGLAYPPNVGEFRGLCRAAPRKDAPKALPHFPTPEEVARAREAANKAAAMVQKPRDMLGWAKQAGSPLAVDAIVTLAKRDDRFANILAALKANKWVTADNKFVPFHQRGPWRDVPVPKPAPTEAADPSERFD